ncbi:unnamed protein product [Lactuca virosa]|uniref:Uncharacterized protein n=1 Tax=Lactuca virosa TaxID=75947 RepID=A0AAU9M302_9ASTR|nr:unnamed protein product [Lactuca virosa]
MRRVSTSIAFGGSFCNLLHLMGPLAISIILKGDVFCILTSRPDHSKSQQKEVLSIVDLNGSKRGKTIEATKTAVVARFSKMDQKDSFSILEFNDQTYLYSSTLEFERSGMNFIPAGGKHPQTQTNRFAGSYNLLYIFFCFLHTLCTNY